MPDAWEPLREWTALILSSGLLLKPLAVRGYRHLVPPKVGFMPSGELLVGYDGRNGPGLSIAGTLTVARSDLTLSSAQLTLSRGSASYALEWTHQSFFGQGSPATEFQPAVALQLAPGTSMALRLLFTDPAVAATVRRTLDSLQLSARTYIDAQLLAKHGRDWASSPDPLVWQDLQLVAQTFEREDPSVVEAHGELQRQCYWSPDTWALKIEFRDLRRREPFVYESRFILDQRDVKELRLNVVGMISAATGTNPNPHYYIAEAQANP